MRIERTGTRFPGRGAAIVFVALSAIALLALLPGKGEGQESGAVWVLRGGIGHGTITSDPAGIACTVSSGGPSGACIASYPEGTRVRLAATPAADSRFVGWAPQRSCPDAPDVRVQAGVVHTCSFVFELITPASFLLQAVQSGSGFIASSPPGIDSGWDGVAGVLTGSSAASYPAGTVVTLAAAPLAGWSFSGWGGDDPDCADGVVTMDAAKRCVATFVPGATVP